MLRLRVIELLKERGLSKYSLYKQLGMSYQGAMAIYYRALKKLRKRMKGDDRN